MNPLNSSQNSPVKRHDPSFTFSFAGRLLDSSFNVFTSRRCVTVSWFSLTLCPWVMSFWRNLYVLSRSVVSNLAASPGHTEKEELSRAAQETHSRSKSLRS